MNLKNQAGQMIVEMILILTILFGLTIFISAQFKQNELIAQVISGPWAAIAGMLENGTWEPAASSMGAHPSNPGLHISLDGETAK